ncbi:MAG TPA: pyroglutamyl-peptidase I [Lysobacter sp.]|nr:pyroglutamyl-peptidase I [Lysobacter sp.]
MSDTAATVLLTGFEPFGGETINPSWQAVRRLDGEIVAGHVVAARCLPVEFDRSLAVLREALDALGPRLVLCVGQAGGRAALSLERVAINLDDARIPDNAGRQPVDEPVDPRGPTAHFARLPLKAMLAALREAGIPAEISQTAGTFVCNHVFYGLMQALPAHVRGGFVHIPFCPEQAAYHPGAPSMALDTVVDALRIAVLVALTTGNDLRLAAGAEH